MTTRIALEECSTLAGIRVLHQAIVEAFADPDPIMIDAGVDKAYRGREKASDHAPTWVRLR